MIEYSVIFSGRRTVAIEIKRDGSVVVRAPYRTSVAEIECILEEKRKWIEKHQKSARRQLPDPDSFSEEEVLELKARAETIIPPIVSRFKDTVGVSPVSVRINRAKRRFGSCSSKGRLNFSCFLCLYPIEAIEYVVVHELCHMLVHNHSAAFYSEVGRVLSDYKERERILRNYDGGEN